MLWCWFCRLLQSVGDAHRGLSDSGVKMLTRWCFLHSWTLVYSAWRYMLLFNSAPFSQLCHKAPNSFRIYYLSSPHPPLRYGLQKFNETYHLNRLPSCSWSGNRPRITQRMTTVKKRSRSSNRSKITCYHRCLLLQFPADSSICVNLPLNLTICLLI